MIIISSSENTVHDKLSPEFLVQIVKQEAIEEEKERREDIPSLKTLKHRYSACLKTVEALEITSDEPLDRFNADNYGTDLLDGDIRSVHSTQYSRKFAVAIMSQPMTAQVTTSVTAE